MSHGDRGQALVQVALVVQEGVVAAGLSVNAAEVPLASRVSADVCASAATSEASRKGRV